MARLLSPLRASTSAEEMAQAAAAAAAEAATTAGEETVSRVSIIFAVVADTGWYSGGDIATHDQTDRQTDGRTDNRSVYH